MKALEQVAHAIDGPRVNSAWTSRLARRDSRMRDDERRDSDAGSRATQDDTPTVVMPSPASFDPAPATYDPPAAQPEPPSSIDPGGGGSSGGGGADGAW